MCPEDGMNEIDVRERERENSLGFCGLGAVGERVVLPGRGGGGGRRIRYGAVRRSDRVCWPLSLSLSPSFLSFVVSVPAKRRGSLVRWCGARVMPRFIQVGLESTSIISKHSGGLISHFNVKYV